MPSRKSNISTITNDDEGSPAPVRARRESLGVDDLSLPRTMIQRLAKGVLPANTSIQKDALLALSKSATVFVNFLASNASENASGQGKKTIMPDDVYAALKDHEFDFMLERVQSEVQKFHNIQCDKRNSYRRKVKAEKSASGPSNLGGEGVDESMISNGGPEDSLLAGGAAARNGEAEPPSKRARRESGDEGEEEEDAFNSDEDPVDAEEEGEDGEDEDDAEDDEEESDEGEGEGGVEQGLNDDEDMDQDRLANGIVDEALDEHDSD